MGELLLPNIMPGYKRECIVQLTKLVLHIDYVKYAALACSACTRYMKTNDEQCRKVSLSYYHRAVKEVNDSLSKVSATRQSIGDPLLMAVLSMSIQEVKIFHPLFAPVLLLTEFPVLWSLQRK